MKYAYGVSF